MNIPQHTKAADIATAAMERGIAGLVAEYEAKTGRQVLRVEVSKVDMSSDSEPNRVEHVATLVLA